MDVRYETLRQDYKRLLEENVRLRSVLKTTESNIRSLANAGLRTETDGPLGPWLDLVTTALAEA
jgi:hypothetical protein